MEYRGDPGDKGECTLCTAPFHLAAEKRGETRALTLTGSHRVGLAMCIQSKAWICPDQQTCFADNRYF